MSEKERYFWKEHFPDVLLAALSLGFACLAVLCMYLHMDKLGELFGTVSGGNLIGALVMRLRNNADPTITKMLEALQKNGQDQFPVVKDKQKTQE